MSYPEITVHISATIIKLQERYCILLQYILYLFNCQPFNLRGHPSGHAATLSSLITYLYLTKSSNNLLLATTVISSLYLFDLCLVYYSDIKDQNNQKLGHSVYEIISGIIIGILSTFMLKKII